MATGHESSIVCNACCGLIFEAAAVAATSQSALMSVASFA